MANANNNVNGNNNNGRGISRREVIESAKNGEGDLVAFVGELRGNRELRLKDLDYNTVLVKTEIDGEEDYIEVLTETENAPSDGVTAYDIAENRVQATAPSVVSGTGRLQVRKTKNGVEKTLVVVFVPMVVYQASEGDLPAHSFAVVEPASETADEPAQDKAQAAPAASFDAENSGWEYGLVGGLFPQGGGKLNLVINGDHTIRDIVIPEGTVFLPRKFKGIVYFVNYEKDETQRDYKRVKSVEASAIALVDKDNLSTTPDGLTGRGVLVASADGVDFGESARVECKAEGYAETFRLVTTKDKGSIPHKYVADTTKGQTLFVTDCKVEMDNRGVKISAAKGGNKDQRDAKRAANAAKAAQAA